MTVLGVAGFDERRGVVLDVVRGGKKRRLPAFHVWVDDPLERNAIALDDYRAWSD